MKKLIMTIALIMCISMLSACNLEEAHKNGDEPIKNDKGYTEELDSESELEDIIEKNDQISLEATDEKTEPAIYNVTEKIAAVPYDTDKAIYTASVVGGSTDFYYFGTGLEFYRYDKPTGNWYQCILELPSQYTDGEIIAMVTGAGSGEIEIISKAILEGQTVYPGCICFNDIEDVPHRQSLSAGINDEQDLIDRGIVPVCGYPAKDAFSSADSENENEDPNALPQKDDFLKKAEEIDEYSKNHYENAITQYDLNNESYNVYMKWEALLSEIYQYLNQNMSAGDFSSVEASEKQWKSDMEEAMENEAEKWENGSGEPMAKNSVGIHHTRERCLYLISLI